MNYTEAYNIAVNTMAQLEPHCEQIAIAGSVRRKKPHVKDIEIVAIAKPYETGLFESGIATVVNGWQCVRGQLERHCRYTQRVLPSGIKLDLFFATKENWGWIYALRTGSADFSHQLAIRLKQQGYKSEDGYIYRLDNGRMIAVPTEEQLFHILQMHYVEPENRI